MPKPGEKSPAPKGEATSPKMKPADSTSEGLVYSPRSFRARFSLLRQETALKIETAADLLEFQQIIAEAQMKAGLIKGEPPQPAPEGSAGNSDTKSDPKPKTPEAPVDAAYADPVDFGFDNYDDSRDFEEADAQEEEAEAFDRSPTPKI